MSFVGSTPIARYVYETAAEAGKRVQALGGAKNHMIVLPDADLDVAADAAVSAGYGSAGERCMAISVVVAVDPSATSWSTRIADRIAESEDRRRRRARHRHGTGRSPRAAPRQGRRLRRRGEPRPEPRSWSTVATLSVDDRPDGFFLGPTLLDHVTPDMTVYRDEIFGPVLTVVRVRPYDEAVRLVNENPYGNGVALFTRDGGAARRFQFEIEAGMVGINVPIPVPMAYYSFGGWNQSLFGDTHMHGAEGVALLHAGQGGHVPMARPGHAHGPDLGFPRTADAKPSTRSRHGLRRRAADRLPRPARGRPGQAPPRPTASRTCGRSTRTCCGRSRTSSTARSCARPAR